MTPRYNSSFRSVALGRDGICLACGSVENLQAHHILMVCLGGQHVPVNGATLCVKCHREVHSMYCGYYIGGPTNPIEMAFWEMVEDIKKIKKRGKKPLPTPLSTVTKGKIRRYKATQ